MKKLILTSLGLTVVVFLLSFLLQTNDVSGMFAGQRWLGQPTSPIHISKLSEDLREVEIVKTVSTKTLLEKGWEVEFSLLKALFNFAVFFGASFAVVFVLSKLVWERKQ